MNLLGQIWRVVRWILAVGIVLGILVGISSAIWPGWIVRATMRAPAQVATTKQIQKAALTAQVAQSQSESQPTYMPTGTPTTSPTSTRVLPTATPMPSVTPTQVPSATPTQTSVPPTSTPVGDSSNNLSTTVSTSSGVSTNPCRDGEVIGNDRNSLGRTPVGLAENVVVSEVAWAGPGFGNFQRAVLVIPQLGEYQVFLLRVDTIHSLRYCGTLDEVKAYVGDKGTHVWAMRATAADGQGNIPDEQEIGVYTIDLSTGKLAVLVPAPKGPALSVVQPHIEVVHLAVTPIPSVAPTHTPSVLATASVTATTVVKCAPTGIDLGPWEPRDRTVAGPAVVNVGFPREGNSQVRVLVPKGKIVVFIAAAGSGWSYSQCGEAQAQVELTTVFAGGLKVVKVDDLISQGMAKWQ